MSRTLVLGDIHGAARALEQVLRRAAPSFDDRIIFLGDVCDGWPETRRCIDILLGLGGLVPLIGNHDVWLRDWAAKRFDPWDRQLWLGQGGYATLRSYGADFYGDPIIDHRFPRAHLRYLTDARPYFEDDGRLFVHGGFRPGIPVDEEGEDVLTWDRSLWSNARTFHRRRQLDGANPIPPYVTEYEEVYIGHTTTTRIGEDRPVNFSNVWNMDTGAGWEGRLSMMDVDTKEVWQSDPVCELYPDDARRRG